MKNLVVVFTTNNARTLNNPDNLAEFSGMPNVAINPDLSAVKGVNREHWKLENGKILPMSAIEKAARDAHIAKNGVDNSCGPAAPVKARSYFLRPLLWLALGSALTLLVQYAASRI